jgi:hypothetical protein
MSQENVGFIRSIYAAWERGDYSSAEWAHPDIEWEFAADGPAPRGGTGLAGMAEDWSAYISAFEEFHHKADEYPAPLCDCHLRLQPAGDHGPPPKVGSASFAAIRINPTRRTRSAT